MNTTPTVPATKHAYETAARIHALLQYALPKQNVTLSTIVLYATVQTVKLEILTGAATSLDVAVIQNVTTISHASTRIVLTLVFMTSVELMLNADHPPTDPNATAQKDSTETQESAVNDPSACLTKSVLTIWLVSTKNV